jgi:hypothetical protein
MHIETQLRLVYIVIVCYYLSSAQIVVGYSENVFVENEIRRDKV